MLLITRTKIDPDSRKKVAEDLKGYIKIVVDVRRKILSAGGEKHVDGEQMLLKDGSRQEDLWGINIYPDQPDENRVEFDSMINIRPYMNNRSRGVENIDIQKKIVSIVKQLVKE